MTSLPSYALLLLLWTFCGQAIASDESEIVLEWMSGLNGDLDNQAEIYAGSTDHDHIQAKFIPIDIPALGSSSSQVYVEAVVNGRVEAMYVCKVSQDDTSKNIVILHRYNFTDYTKYKPGELKVEDLLNLTASDLSGDPECDSKFVSFGHGTFFGIWPHCKHTVNKKHPGFSLMFTCDAYSLTVPLLVAESPSSVPYVFQLKSNRYPLKRRPDNYVSPCDKKKSEAVDPVVG